MNFGLKNAIRDWDMEVDNEAQRLIERGVPPWDAVEQARNTVSARRRDAARVTNPEQTR